MSKSPFLVYVLPVILSISLGTLVMAEALNDPKRELNMWQSDGSTNSLAQEIRIIGLENTYSANESIKFSVKVFDNSFDCGDLYITIYKTDLGNQVITQSGYLKHCFALNQKNLPVDEDYSVSLSESGSYKTIIEFYDETYKETLSYTQSFIVR